MHGGTEKPGDKEVKERKGSSLAEPVAPGFRHAGRISDRKTGAFRRSRTRYMCGSKSRLNTLFEADQWNLICSPVPTDRPGLLREVDGPHNAERLTSCTLV